MNFILAAWGFFAVAILLHEFGHAIPALWLTKENVSIQLGRWQPGVRRVHLPLGRLNIYITLNPFRWVQGLCLYTGTNLSASQKIFIIAGGPVVSLSVSALSWMILVFWLPAGPLGIYMLIFAAISVIMVFGSFIGSAKYFDGKIMRNATNDAARIIELYKISMLPPGWNEAIVLYQNREFVKAADRLEQLLLDDKPKRAIVQAAMGAHINARQYDRALDLHQRFRQRLKPDAYDYTNLGVIYSWQERHEEALHLYRKAINRNDRHSAIVNNYGYGLGQVGEHDQAIIYLDRAIALDPGRPDAYVNRAYSNLHLGNLEEAHRDLEQALSLDNSAAETHAYLGWYHWQKNEFESAEICFQKAMAIDPGIKMEKYRTNIPVL